MIFILARRIQICAVSGCSLSPPDGQLIRSLRIFGTIIVGFSTNKENDKNGSIRNKSHWRIYRLVTQWGSFQNYLNKKIPHADTILVVKIFDSTNFECEDVIFDAYQNGYKIFQNFENFNLSPGLNQATKVGS